tara:strand:+ start:4726 stop:6144 length:1419 start_codon:yes stop_codon:yes gene_type:complete
MPTLKPVQKPPCAKWRRGVALSAIAAALSIGPGALAQTDREAALEARLSQLEGALAALKGELAQARSDQQFTAQQAATSVDIAQKADSRVTAMAEKPAADGFRVGATTFKLGGFVKVIGSTTRYDDGEVASGSLGKEFYLPQQIPVGGKSSRDVIGHARQTRLSFSTSTPLGSKQLKSVIEFDFALAAAPLGAQRATNPYTPTFRRGFISYGNWLIGQEWTTFQNPGHLPETTDFVGPMDGAIFVRQMMVQYKHPLGGGLDLYLAAENPQTETVTSVSPALVDNDQDRIPDLVAKLAYKGKIGEVHVAGLVRELSVHSNGVGDKALGWGITTGVKIPFGPQGRHDIRFLATYGHGMGRYFTVGYAPDAIYDASVGNQLHVVDNFAGFAAIKLGWTRTVRSTLMVGYQHADYPDATPLPALANQDAYSLAGNLFWSPVKNLDLGIEYRHAQRTVVSGLKGQMDRVEMAAKYTF